MTFLYILLALLAIVAVLAIIGPKSYHVNRSMVINKPLPETFNFLKSLRNQDFWSPWEKKDPNMKKEFTGVDGTPGFTSHWEGNKDVGVGEQEIKRIVENERIESELRFIKPWKSVSDCYIKTEKVDANSTRVTWGFSGNNKFPMTIMALFMSMDKMVGKDFEEGLKNLKSHLEK